MQLEILAQFHCIQANIQIKILARFHCIQANVQIKILARFHCIQANIQIKILPRFHCFQANSCLRLFCAWQHIAEGWNWREAAHSCALTGKENSWACPVRRLMMPMPGVWGNRLIPPTATNLSPTMWHMCEYLKTNTFTCYHLLRYLYGITVQIHIHIGVALV